MKKPGILHQLPIPQRSGIIPIENFQQQSINLILTGGLIVVGMLIKWGNPTPRIYIDAFKALIATGVQTILIALCLTQALNDMQCRNLPSIRCRI